MRISLNEIKKIVPEAASVSTDELVKLIGSRLVEVEGTINLAPKYDNIYIVRVAECEPIPDTHLSLCQIETPEKVQVVCGAPNVRKGMHAVWIAPGAIVPQTFGEENFKLDVRKLRGYESHGMLAGLDELDLGDDHSGIVEIDPKIAPGTPFAEAFDLNDIILDIENKSLTHRPDTFGLIGFAREVAGILGVKFSGDLESGSFEWRLATTGASERSEPRNDGRERASHEKEPTIQIADNDLCSRYSCAVIERKDALEDDKYLTAMDVFLAKAGMRGISKIVDVTNYLMLMTGQPLHAFDYDKFIKVGGKSQPEIGVRIAKAGEELQLLDGKTIKCTADDILITSGDVPVALAGAMGGASTEIDASTSRVLLESATFSLYNLRKTQMAHGIFSEAITRFTKGQPASQTLPVLQSACNLLGGNVISVSDNYAKKPEQTVVKITTPEINALLGTSYSTDIITKTLENVGFKLNSSERRLATTGASERSEPRNDGREQAGREELVELEATTPAWRTDIHIKEDLIEEVGRLLGYDNIALDFPKRPFIGATKDPMLDLKSRIRATLSDQLAAHELLTYSFVSRSLQETVGEDPEDSYEIVNSISPELQRFRQSLIPSLLEKTRDNLKSGHKDFALYEINQVTKKSYGKDADGVPKMHTHLAFIITGDFYQMKARLEALLKALGFKDLSFHQSDGHFSYLEPLRSATVQTPHVCCGEIKQPVLKRLKISEQISAFEISLDELLEALPESAAAAPRLSKFPSVERDITIKVKSDTAFAAAADAIRAAIEDDNLIFEVAPVSIYQADEKFKNLSFRLKFASLKKTLESAEISAIMETIQKSVKTAVGAEII